MGLLGKIFGNTRKPEGFFGRLMVAGMNGGSHAAMATWGLEKIDIPQTGEILDIGCGGGANIARLLARSKAATAATSASSATGKERPGKGQKASE